MVRHGESGEEHFGVIILIASMANPMPSERLEQMEGRDLSAATSIRRYRVERYICIHGHFYQPPRENPWIEEIELQDSAYPYHDWNERITAECYAPNTASRLLDGEGRILAIVNNYSKMSFNFGPTLLGWMERRDPSAYRSILEADKLSRHRFSGHGSALAQAYNHMIMPLANSRDKRSQVIWGIKDFQKRFGRDPEGMWLPETAVDTETLEILAEKEIRFTILAPSQAKSFRKIGGPQEWQSIEAGKIDPSTGYLCRLPSGRNINLFFYDGPISHEVAFGGLLTNGEGFAKRLTGAFSDARDRPELVHIATDGETYGHHHHYGDMALTFCLHSIESNNFAKLTNYGEFLEKHPPTHEVEVLNNSSWSCSHGVERWRENCGCNSGMHGGWHQNWRQPLRVALDALRDQLAPAYTREASVYLKDPWEARDNYIEIILDRAEENIKDFLKRHAVRELSKEEKSRVLKLLEIQRHAMLMYTSCGWFFDEISGPEAVQLMEYASMAMQRTEEILGLSLERLFISDLEKAPSNVFENGAEVYRRFVIPSKVDLTRVGAHYAVSSLFNDYPEHMEIFNFTVESENYEKVKAGKIALATGKARIRSDFTRDAVKKSFAVLHLGDHNISGGLTDFKDEEAFSSMRREIWAAFEQGDTTGIIRLMGKHFGMNNFSIWHLFRDEQRKVIHQILEVNHVGIEASYRKIYEDNNPVMNFLGSINIPIPKPIFLAVEHIINVDMKRAFGREEVDIEKLKRLILESNRWGIHLDKAAIEYDVSLWVTSLMEKVSQDPINPSLFVRITKALELLEPLSLNVNFWKAQNIYLSLKEQIRNEMSEKAEKSHPSAREWLDPLVI
jgi:alpha-amylase/alpha-mannosidase (GH57 family)